MATLRKGSQKVCPVIKAERIGINRVVISGVYQPPTSSFIFTLPDSATDIATFALAYAYRGATGLTEIDFSDLTQITGSYALYYAFRSCTNLTTANFSGLSSISASRAFNYSFQDCTKLSSVDFSNLSQLTGTYALSYAFSGCTSLKILSFPKLTSSSFGSATSQFNLMLSGVSGCTVHFPASVQSTIGSWSDVSGGFGGTNTVVLFDL